MNMERWVFVYGVVAILICFVVGLVFLDAWFKRLERALRRFDVRDYGAVGDGQTDDSEAIQMAIDAAIIANGGTVTFPRSTYVTSTPVAGIEFAQVTSPVSEQERWAVVRISDRGTLGYVQWDSAWGEYVFTSEGSLKLGVRQINVLWRMVNSMWPLPENEQTT